MSLTKSSHSIAAKLHRIVFLTLAGLLFAVLVSNLVLDGASEQAAVKQRLDAAASLVAENSATAMYFDDRSEAQRVLNNLDAVADVRQGILYDAQGKIYAEFHKKGIVDNDLEFSATTPAAPLAPSLLGTSAPLPLWGPGPPGKVWPGCGGCCAGTGVKA